MTTRDDDKTNTSTLLCSAGLNECNVSIFDVRYQAALLSGLIKRETEIFLFLLLLFGSVHIKISVTILKEFMHIIYAILRIAKVF